MKNPKTKKVCPTCRSVLSKKAELSFSGKICSKCYTILDKYNSRKSSIGVILYELLDRKGKEVLQNPKLINSWLMDYIITNKSEEKKERQLIINALENKQLLSIIEEIKTNSNDKLDKFISDSIPKIIQEMNESEGDSLYIAFVFAIIFEMIPLEKVYISHEADKIINSIEYKKLTEDEIRSLATVGKEHLRGYKELSSTILSENDLLLQVDLPENVESIENSAFKNCINLESIKLSKNVNKIGKQVFEGCISLHQCEVEEDNPRYKMIAGSLVDRNEKYVIRFFTNSVKNGTVSKRAHQINSCCFESTELECIEIPEAISTIEENAFLDNKQLKEFKVCISNDCFETEEGVLFTKGRKTLINYPAGKTEQCYIFPKGVTELQSSAFMSAEYLRTILLPSSLSTIGSRVFQGCTNLEWAVLGNLKHISDSMFDGCSSLKKIIIPKSVSTIGKRAFASCESLKEFYVSSNIIHIDESCFDNTPNVEIIIDNNEYVETYCTERGLTYRKGDIYEIYTRSDCVNC